MAGKKTTKLDEMIQPGNHRPWLFQASEAIVMEF